MGSLLKYSRATTRSLLISSGSAKRPETSFTMLSVGLARELAMATLNAENMFRALGLGRLAYGAFHFHLDEPVELYRVLHRQDPGEGFHESSDDHAESLSLRQSAGH